MIVINDEGDIVHTGDGYIAEGKTTICLPLTDEMSDVTISTDRGYDIVLTKGDNTEQWYINLVILSTHKKIEKCSEQKLRQTRRRTQAGLTPGKDDNEVWHIFCRNR